MRNVWLVREGDVLASAEVAESPSARVRGVWGHHSDAGALLLLKMKSVHSAGVSYQVGVAFLDESMTVMSCRTLKPWRLAVAPGACHVLVTDAAALERWRLRPGDVIEVREPTEPA